MSVGCPDGGTCHHDCQTVCWRVEACSPLSGVFPGDAWPPAVRRAHRGEGEPSPTRRLMAALDAERTLAGRMAEALRAVRADRPSGHSDDVWAKVLSALAAYDEAHP